MIWTWNLKLLKLHKGKEKNRQFNPAKNLFNRLIAPTPTELISIITNLTHVTALKNHVQQHASKQKTKQENLCNIGDVRGHLCPNWNCGFCIDPFTNFSQQFTVLTDSCTHFTLWHTMGTWKIDLNGILQRIYSFRQITHFQLRKPPYGN